MTDEDMTLEAVDDETGDHITFADPLAVGSDVSLYDDPDSESGFRGIRRLYCDERGWRLRELTAVEKRRLA